MTAKSLTAPKPTDPFLQAGLPEARCYLSRHVVIDGHDCGLAIVSTAADGTLVIEPFTRETPSTTYLPGTLRITLSPLTVSHEL